jgi:hypothetical protein
VVAPPPTAPNAGDGRLRRAPLTAIDAVNLAVWFTVLLVALLPGGGRDLYLLATGATIASILLGVLGQGRFPGLITAFQVGFVVIVAVEGIFQADVLTNRYGPEAFSLASRYLVGSLAVVVLGHGAVHRALADDEAAPARWTADPARSITAMVAMGVVYLLGIWPRVTARVTSGRVGDFEPWFAGSAFEPIVSGLVGAAGMLLPAMVAYQVVRLQGRRFTRAVLLASPVLAVQFAIGTRFPLLFAVAGMVIVSFAGRRLRPSVVLRALAVAAGLFVLSASMTQFRSVGLGNVEADDLSISLERVSEGERTVKNLIEITDWFDASGYAGGSSSVTVAAFFIPRVLWPDKPEAMGYWFPRRYGEAGFSAGHSIAYSFAGDPYADFGFGGGMVAVLGLGLALGVADRWCSARLARPSEPTLVIVGPLYGAAFFAARSVDTAFIATCGLFALGSLYVWFVRRRIDTGADRGRGVATEAGEHPTTTMPPQ